MANDVTNREDVIDSRDVIRRIEELESEIESAYEDAKGEAAEFPPIVEWMEKGDHTLGIEIEELAALKSLAEQAEGYSDWIHGATLIRDSYFENYARELAEDLHGSKIRDAEWPFSCIDWERAATEVQQDYTSVEFDGVTYWVR